MHFPPFDGKKPNPSHEEKSTSVPVAKERKMMIASVFDTTSKQTSGQTNRMTYFPRFAFNIS